MKWRLSGAARRRWRRFWFPPVGARLGHGGDRLAVSCLPLLGWIHYLLAACSTRALFALAVAGLLPATLLFALGMDTAPTLIGYALLAWMVAGAAAGYWWRPRLRMQVATPPRVLCGMPFELRYTVANNGRRPLRDLAIGTLFFPDPLQLRLRGAWLPWLAAGAVTVVTGRGLALRRGRYRLPPLRCDSAFPGGLWRWGRTDWQERPLTVYPAFTPLREFDLPLGARHRQELNAARHLAREALEFHGCREYREGDVLRHVHPRSSARLGVPVVKEFQAEGRGRTALLVDTWRAPWPVGFWLSRRDPVEQVLSLAAAAVDALARSERVLELLAAGPGVYRFVSSGSGGYREDALDILASLEPCARDPLTRLEPLLLEEIRAIQSVCLLFTRWDERRAQLVQLLEAWRVGLKVVVVAGGSGRRDPRLPPEVVNVSARAVRRGEVLAL